VKSLVVLLFALISTGASAANESAALIAKFEADLKAVDAAIAGGKTTIDQYSKRGDLRFFLGQFAEAVQDYEKMTTLDKTLADTHWRLGIAYYFSGEFAKSAELFEKLHKYDDVDRETALWHFLAKAGIDGVGQAQLQMLRYTKPDRDPFDLIYDLFSGLIKTDEMFRHIQKRGLFTDQKAMFYARLYAGIFANLNGNHPDAKKFLSMAEKSEWGKKASGGPGFMAQVARIVNDAVPTN
jgi:tetratricopeptide (TPR) repeat protein